MTNSTDSVGVKQDLMTKIVPVDATLIHVFDGDAKKWSPYIGAGLSITRMEIDNQRRKIQDPATFKPWINWAPGVHAMVGEELFLQSNENVSLDFSIRYTYLFSENTEDFPSGFTGKAKNLPESPPSGFPASQQPGQTPASAPRPTAPISRYGTVIMYTMPRFRLPTSYSSLSARAASTCDLHITHCAVAASGAKLSNSPISSTATRAIITFFIPIATLTTRQSSAYLPEPSGVVRRNHKVDDHARY